MKNRLVLLAPIYATVKLREYGKMSLKYTLRGVEICLRKSRTKPLLNRLFHL